MAFFELTTADLFKKAEADGLPWVGVLETGLDRCLAAAVNEFLNLPAFSLSVCVQANGRRQNVHIVLTDAPGSRQVKILDLIERACKVFSEL